MINYNIERGKLYKQCKGQGWWKRGYRINTTMMNRVAALGWPHIIIWYKAALIMMGGYKNACGATWMVLIGVTVTGRGGQYLQKFCTPSIGLVSSWLSKWVWKHGFPCCDSAVVVVSAALKIKRAASWGNAHVEEPLHCSIFFHKAHAWPCWSHADTCVCRDACIQWNAR